MTSSRSQRSSKLTVKKTRAAASSRKDTAPKAARAPKKTSPVRNGEAASAEVSRPSESLDELSNDLAGAMEGITTGMKKIRINLITQSQREAREKARLEAEKAASVSSGDGPQGATSITHPPTSRPQPESGDSPSTSSATGAGDTTEPAVSSEPLAPQVMASTGLDCAVEESSPPPLATPDPRQHRPALPGPGSSPASLQGDVQPHGDALFIPYQPEGSTPAAISQQGPLTWMTPNAPTPSDKTQAATPSPDKRQDALFHYTSGIPFAPRSQSDETLPAANDPGRTAQAKETEADQGSSSMWEVPETPPG